MTDSQPLTADALRRQVAARLADAGLDSAAADAAELVAQVLGVEPGRLLLIDEVDSGQQLRITAAAAQRARRIPLQHITSRAHFAGLELTVGPGVFIPRPETEAIVEWALARIAERSPTSPITVVDLCSGSGALALAIAALAPQTRVIAVEMSTAAGRYLRGNVDDLELADRVRVVRADVTDRAAMLPLLRGADIVVSNPPYVPAQSPVSPEVAHDPPEAVFSGDSGMDVIAAMVPILAEALVGGAVVAVEHDDTTAPQVCATLHRTGAFSAVTAHRDLAGRPRYVSAVRTGPGEAPPPAAGGDPTRSSGPDVERWDG